MLKNKELLDDCVKWAKEAGCIQMGYFRKDNLDIRQKFNYSDIVTAADKASEEAIIAEIRKKYPSHSILSEESGADKMTADYQWVIDPLDGTTNFSSGLPYFSVSIGIKHRGETIVGVVFAPYLGELFTAIKGEGALLNGERISCGQKDDLRQAVVATGFPVDKDRNTDNNTDNVARILPLVRGMRRLGSAAIDICYVACGNLDAYWELNLHEWDVCAGLLIASEAGATFKHFRSDRNISVIAATPSIMTKIAPLISEKPFTDDPFGIYHKCLL